MKVHFRFRKIFGAINKKTRSPSKISVEKGYLENKEKD
jgi:hypothetical protein